MDAVDKAFPQCLWRRDKFLAALGAIDEFDQLGRSFSEGFDSRLDGLDQRGRLTDGEGVETSCR